MITGESGTGKELVARALHDYGRRRAGPFVAVNMAAIPRELIESELFGHERGAFTGALNRGVGRFEQAAGGTLFLDEIGELPLGMQAKLLRVLQDGTFERVGGNRPLRSDFRLIAATNRDLATEVQEGRFRGDLYYRLNVVPIEIPPLRERREDIPYLARHFVEKLAPESGGRVRGITDAAIDKLMQYSWPGNVRELENVIERSIVMAIGEKLDAGDIRLDMNLRPRQQQSGNFSVPEGMSLDAYEQEIIRNALQQAHGNKSQAARALGLTRNALRYRLTQMGIES
jgi:DNA-binding NtrC family response regulator